MPGIISGFCAGAHLPISVGWKAEENWKAEEKITQMLIESNLGRA